MFVGVDGYAKGWVAVGVDASGFVEARCFSNFNDLMVVYGRETVVAVDMPIGVTDDPERAADSAARGFLKGQASSVFNTPVRSVLRASSYEEAGKISNAVCGKGLSKQSFAILPKIREGDAHAKNERVFEVHPEVSFRILNEGRIPQGKKTWGGLQRRLTLLESVGIVLPASIGEADVVGIDDVVDAAVAAWSARRVAGGEARRFPADAGGGGGARLGAIWA